MIADRLHHFLDDAATFPPGNLSLADAVRAHDDHLSGPVGDLVGPLVVAADDVAAVGALAAGRASGPLPVSVTAPSPATAAQALRRSEAYAALRVDALEVALPAGLPAAEVVPSLIGALGDPGGLNVFVELPRDERRGSVVRALAASPYHAKLRTGGLAAEQHPGEQELAEAVVALVSAGVAFKATAGLHHAVRRTDPATGFEQHGFLNLLLATDAAIGLADVAEVQVILAERDPAWVADRARRLSHGVRLWCRSIGTCSIAEPVEDLVALGLLTPATREVTA